MSRVCADRFQKVLRHQFVKNVLRGWVECLAEKWHYRRLPVHKYQIHRRQNAIFGLRHLCKTNLRVSMYLFLPADNADRSLFAGHLCCRDLFQSCHGIHLLCPDQNYSRQYSILFLWYGHLRCRTILYPPARKLQLREQACV